MRLLMLAHGHPEVVAGGAEQAAWSLHRRLLEVGIDSVLVARADPAAIGHPAPFGAWRGRADELLAEVPATDPFLLESRDLPRLARMVDALVARFRPDVAHVQHHGGWGLDVIGLLARAGVPVVVTLHDFLPICHREGKMVRVNGQLCHAASPVECSGCFPDHAAADFHLRREAVLGQLAPAARIVVPSAFVRDRLVAWGLAAERVAVADNPLSPGQLAMAGQGAGPPTEGRIGFGYFGQINAYKGVDLLLEAVALLPASVRRRVAVGVHGRNLAAGDRHFTERLEAAAQAARSAAGPAVRFLGPYGNADVVPLMAGYDWIVVPSTWWETASVVMDEAFLAGRPVLAAGLGALAEKLARGYPGRMFRAGDPVALADAMAAIVAAGPQPRPPGAVPPVEAERLHIYRQVYEAAIAGR